MFYFKSRYSYIITVVITTAVAIASAEVVSGFWLHVSPSEAPGAYQADFNVLSSALCTSLLSTTSTCSVEVADCSFEYGRIHASKGMYLDSSISVQLRSLVEGKEVTPNRNVQFYLDSMLKKMELAAPETEYVDSIPYWSDAFFLKTSENYYAVMIRVYEYIGAYDRMGYYWAYQTDGSTKL